MFTSELDRATDADGYEMLPSKREMFQMIQLLAAKCDAMETQMKQMRGSVQYKHQAINIPELLLMGGNPNTTVDEMVGGLVVPLSEFIRILDTSVDVMIADLIYENVNCKTNGVSPIRCVSTHPNRLYLWDGDGYVVAQTDTLTRLYDTIHHKLLVQFSVWDSENKHQMQRDDYTKLYTQIAKKLLGGNISKDALVRKVVRRVYSDIVEDIGDLQCQ